jgi:hypothetical protein
MLEVITRFLESDASLAFNRNPRKARCRGFMLTFAPEGGLWSTTDLLEQIRLFSSQVLSKYRD